MDIIKHNWVLVLVQYELLAHSIRNRGRRGEHKATDNRQTGRQTQTDRQDRRDRRRRATGSRVPTHVYNKGVCGTATTESLGWESETKRRWTRLPTMCSGPGALLDREARTGGLRAHERSELCVAYLQRLVAPCMRVRASVTVYACE